MIAISRSLLSAVKVPLICALALFLFSCQSTDNQTHQSRKTLADLANEQQSAEIERVKLNREQRAKKLSELYKTILTLEPDTEVRAQIEYRLVQMNTQAFELMDDQAYVNDETMQASAKTLDELILSYQDLITRFPDRADNEWMQYQLAKALDLQGKLEESLQQMEVLLATYPNSKYRAELHFRRGDIYYNFQEYDEALNAYQAAAKADDNEKYYVNSRYMSAWVLFKLNRLAEADSAFISLLDYLIEQDNQNFNPDDFNFDKLDPRYASLITDVQRVLSISLSQQQQSKSLVKLTKQSQDLNNLSLYRHILFDNLANFLIKNELKYDAELTYQSYIAMEPNSIWAARYSIELLALLEKQGKYSASRDLKQKYVKQFGLNSPFWKIAHERSPNESLTAYDVKVEVIPNLLKFSYQHSRRLYAQAQRLKPGKKRVSAFVKTSDALATYLAIAKLPQTNYLKDKPKQSESILADELLFADASLEAHQYQQALKSYQLIAYGKEQKIILKENNADNYLSFKSEVSAVEASNTVTATSDANNNREHYSNNTEHDDTATKKIRLEAAYATTLTAREMLKLAKVKTTDTINTPHLNNNQKVLLLTRNHLDQLFILNYPDDIRVLTLATQAAQYAYSANDYQAVEYYSGFILKHHIVGFNEETYTIKPNTKNKPLKPKALKQVQIVSQLQANSLYHQKSYVQAETAYQLALRYVGKQSNVKKYKEMRELLSSCIYFQAQKLVQTDPLSAVEHYLRLGKVVPESSYRLNAEFDAGNILLAQKKWQQGINVLTAFKKRYPKHEYSRTIAAKLAKAYESTEQWELAATQLLAMINGPESAGFSKELKREAQYTAAEYYQKAGNNEKALLAYRTYAHQYPDPFVVAQEVRLKLSEFYQKQKDTNKQYFWYRKIVKYHDIQLRNAPSKITTRAEYLASFAALGLGKAHQQTFSWVKLKLPLAKNLKRKQAAMKSAVGYYQKVLSYQLAEFVPQASFNLAKMYRLLASDIMASERPKDLDELELEEYEFVLEDIAIPFEDKAIEIHKNNAERAWQNVYDIWVEESFNELAELDPAQYNKKERVSHVIPSIY